MSKSTQPQTESEPAKFTPGPWLNLNCADHPDLGGYVVLGSDGFMVADCNIFGANAPRDDETNQANAFLTAAAPDLLAVCKLAVFNETKADELRGSGMVDHVDVKALRAIANAARVAIAKAEGGAA